MPRNNPRYAAQLLGVRHTGTSLIAEIAVYSLGLRSSVRPSLGVDSLALSPAGESFKSPMRIKNSANQWFGNDCHSTRRDS
jgi:hypothetical protein